MNQRDDYIRPTVGRIVHYHRGYADTFPDVKAVSVYAAIVTYVHPDEAMVNLAVFDAEGGIRPRQRVRLLQPYEPPPLGREPWCTWMPYQIKKATGSESGERVAGTESISHESVDGYAATAERLFPGRPRAGDDIPAGSSEDRPSESDAGARAGGETNPAE